MILNYPLHKKKKHAGEAPVAYEKLAQAVGGGQRRAAAAAPMKAAAGSG